MAMGTRKDQEQQEEMWIPQASLAKGASHPFYQRLNQLLEENHFDEFVEGRCGGSMRRNGGGRAWRREFTSGCC
jgi:hypothetical protein